MNEIFKIPHLNNPFEGASLKPSVADMEEARALHTSLIFSLQSHDLAPLVAQPHAGPASSDILNRKLGEIKSQQPHSDEARQAFKETLFLAISTHQGYAVQELGTLLNPLAKQSDLYKDILLEGLAFAAKKDNANGTFERLLSTSKPDRHLTSVIETITRCIMDDDQSRRGRWSPVQTIETYKARSVQFNRDWQPS
jgi:hypothetical protein